MASSLASQLQSLKSLIQADDEPLKRPFTRPSILYDPKEAADIDLDAILDIARSGDFEFHDNYYCFCFSKLKFVLNIGGIIFSITDDQK